MSTFNDFNELTRTADMPEIQPEKNQRPHRQCEIRRPSPPAVLNIGGTVIHKPAGYYFDVVWIDADIARIHTSIVDDRGRTWAIVETFGVKPMARSRQGFHKATTPDNQESI